jgi:hypothetical protein
MVDNGPDFAHGRKNKGGRPFGSVTKAKLELRDLLRKTPGPRELHANIRDLTLNHPDGYVRLGATKLWAEYAYGKPINSDENPNGPTIVQVVTGVTRRGPDEVLSASRPLLPDGRDPFAQPPPAPQSGRPIGRAPVAEPPCTARLTEGPGDIHSAPRRH